MVAPDSRGFLSLLFPSQRSVMDPTEYVRGNRKTNCIDIIFTSTERLHYTYICGMQRAVNVDKYAIELSASSISYIALHLL